MPHFDLLILGTGSGNSILTPEFEDWEVAVVERAAFGGTCLNAGCIPSKMFVLPADRMVEAEEATERLGVTIDARAADWPAIRDRVFSRIDPIAAGGRRYRMGQDHVTVFEGDARFVGKRTLRVLGHDGSEVEVSADRVVLAAGASPRLPHLPGLDSVPFHTSDTVMRLERLPEHLIILGGGFIAAELGHVFRSLGSKVSVVHRGDRMLRHEDAEVSARFSEVFCERVDLYFDSHATAVRAEGGRITVEFDQQAGPDGPQFGITGSSVTGDVLLVTTGRDPNSAQIDVAATGVDVDHEGYVITDETLATSAEGIWALGDIRNPLQLKHLANQEAHVVSHNLRHPEDPMRIDQRVVPHAVFSNPQIGSVGLTEEQLRVAGATYLVGRRDYGGVAYGWALEDTTGFAKVLVDRTTKRLLGAHVIGPQAATLVQQLAQAMTFEIPADRLAHEQIWCHPALPEVLENALLDALD
jgi:mycothione reductase